MRLKFKQGGTDAVIAVTNVHYCKHKVKVFDNKPDDEVDEFGNTYRCGLLVSQQGMAKYGKAAMTEMIIKVLPQMAEAIAKPLESIDKVSIIGGAGDSGMSAISDNVPQVLAKTIESVKETTGFDLTEVMKANTYDAKVNNNINVATDFGEKITENAVKETTAEMHKNKIPSDSKDECFDYENM